MIHSPPHRAALAIGLLLSGCYGMPPAAHPVAVSDVARVQSVRADHGLPACPGLRAYALAVTGAELTVRCQQMHVAGCLSEKAVRMMKREWLVYYDPASPEVIRHELNHACEAESGGDRYTHTGPAWADDVRGEMGIP